MSDYEAQTIQMIREQCEARIGGKTDASTAGLERMFRVSKLDHPDLAGGIVWSCDELTWINERITLAVMAEREACAKLVETMAIPGALDEERGKREIAEAIRMRSNVK